MSIKELRARLKELDRAKDFINSDYYWQRRKQLIEKIDKARLAMYR